jgi:hypothetical protein
MPNYLTDDCSVWADFLTPTGNDAGSALTQTGTNNVTVLGGVATFPTLSSLLINSADMRTDGGSITVAARVKALSLATDQTVWSAAGGAELYAFRCRNGNSTTASVTTSQGAVSITNTTLSTSAFSWVFAIITSDTRRLYIPNSTSVSAFTGNAYFTDFSTNSVIGSGFTGDMSFFGLWNRALTIADMEALMGMSATTYSVASALDVLGNNSVAEPVFFQREVPASVGSEAIEYGHLRINRGLI